MVKHAHQIHLLLRRLASLSRLEELLCQTKTLDFFLLLGDTTSELADFTGQGSTSSFILSELTPTRDN